MQISRQLLLACAVTMCLNPTLVHAFDNEAQIRARQALEDKMKQLETQAPQTTSSPPAAVKKTTPKKSEAKPTPPAVVTKPVAKPAPPVVENPPAQPTATYAPEISQPATPANTASSATMSAPPANSTNDKLREALHEKMSQTPEPPVVTFQPSAKPAKPTPVVKAPIVKESAPVVVTKPAPPANPTPAITAAPSYSPLPAPSTKPSPTLPDVATIPATPAAASTVTQPAASLPQIMGPPSSLSSTKQQKLDSLLQRYRDDQLTPQQYHEQRAKILSEP